VDLILFAISASPLSSPSGEYAKGQLRLTHNVRNYFASALRGLEDAVGVGEATPESNLPVGSKTE
jgi:hypothetical protein